MNIPKSIMIPMIKQEKDGSATVFQEVPINTPEKLEERILEEIKWANHHGKFPTRILLDQEWFGSGIPAELCGVPLFEAFGLPVILVYHMKRYYPFDGVEVIS